MLDSLGPQTFDQICGDLKIGPWKNEDHLEGARLHLGDSGERASPQFQAGLKPGDYTYFKNWDVSAEGRAAGWQGENVIYLGGGEYYGHPFGITTGEHIVDYLNGQRNEGSTTPATMLDYKTQLDANLLKYRVRP